MRTLLLSWRQAPAGGKQNRNEVNRQAGREGGREGGREREREGGKYQLSFSHNLNPE